MIHIETLYRSCIKKRKRKNETSIPRSRKVVLAEFYHQYARFMQY